MTRCNYVALDIDPMSTYLDELFDLDILCTEEGIFINVAREE